MNDEMSYALKWILFIVGMSMALTVLGWFWKYNTAPISGKVNAEVQLESAETRINSYNHFFNLCAAIQGYEGALEAQKASLTGATGDEAQRIRANIAGITAQRVRSIQQYNADALKAYTTARFLDSELPRSLAVSQGNTRCVN